MDNMDSRYGQYGQYGHSVLTIRTVRTDNMDSPYGQYGQSVRTICTVRTDNTDIRMDNTDSLYGLMAILWAFHSHLITVFAVLLHLLAMEIYMVLHGYILNKLCSF